MLVPPRPRPLAPPPSPPRNDRVAGDDDDDEEEDAAWDDAVKRDPHIKKEGETSRGLKRKSPEPEAAPTQPESPRSKYVGSKYVGVYNQGGTTWRAQHSNRYLGMFQTELEAGSLRESRGLTRTTDQAERPQRLGFTPRHARERESGGSPRARRI